MKALRSDVISVIIFFVVWRLLLLGIEILSPSLFSLRNVFTGPIPWTNFDGVHYLTIAREGYYQYQQAFFPLYPMLIRQISLLFHIPIVISGLVISHVSFFIGLLLFFAFLSKDNPKSRYSTIILFLLFPSSFFFAALYPESLYFMLSALTFYAIEKRLWWLAGVAGLCASATRLFGVYLYVAALVAYFAAIKQRRAVDIAWLSLIPVGLFLYMIYLWQSIGDPLAFFHVQPAFGANRSGGQFIMLPQVLWRYLKILGTVPSGTHLYTVALFELLSFAFSMLLVFKAWKIKMKFHYIIYAIAVIITPTLTGTLSSFPRYLLAAFPLFGVLGRFTKGVQYIFMVIFGSSLVYVAAAYLRGYFVS